MALNESATATLVEDDTVGTMIEENALLRDATVTRHDNGGAATTAGDRVRQRLAVCFFLHTVAGAVLGQVYPRVRPRICAVADVPVRSWFPVYFKTSNHNPANAVAL